MSISSWAKNYCTQSPELILLFNPSLDYLCESKALTRFLSDCPESITEFFKHLPADQYQQPDLSAFSLQLKHVNCQDNLYCYHFKQQNDDEHSWKKFADTMTNLHAIIRRISQAETLDKLYQHAILEAQQQLYIDRLAIFLLDTKTNEMVGTWGTDENGNVKSESWYREPIPASHRAALTLTSKGNVKVWENVDLLFDKKVVGKGWNAMATIWDGDTPIGWLACDNLINKRPMQPWLKEIICQYSQALGHIIVRFKNLQKLQDINHHLEDLVAERTAQLSEKAKQLETSQNELVDSEKFASLGELVAGVTHEVNTPIGIGVTAISHLAQQTKEIKLNYLNKTMKKSQLDDYFQCATDSAEMIQANLLRAADLIQSFKQLAVDQSLDGATEINLKDLVDNIQKSFHHQFKNKPIEFINHIDKNLYFYICPGKLNQIFTNLVNNSLLHAFEKKKQGSIEVHAKVENKFLKLSYFDTGDGVEDENLNKLLAPFFTTKRGEGGTGLGLNIVYNIIKEHGGEIQLSHAIPSGLKFDITLPVKVKK